jgi:hypothetical protein
LKKERATLFEWLALLPYSLFFLQILDFLVSEIRGLLDDVKGYSQGFHVAGD